MSIAIQGYNYIVIHHSESSFNAKVSDLKAGCLRWMSDSEKKYYTDQGYCCDYHKFIRNNGTVEFGQPLKYWTANCGIQEINVQSLAICCIGSLQTNNMPEKMFVSLVNEVKYWMKLYKIPREKVMLHRDIVATSCPGDYFPEERFMVAIMPEVPVFKDVDPKRWSYAAIKRMKERHLISGDPDGRFRPREAMTREEVAVLLDSLIEKFELDGN
jgi:hypothetical protein